MTVLWIIGNGFDIQHDLPSRYQDFKSWLHHNEELSDCPADESLCDPKLDSLLYLKDHHGGEEPDEVECAKLICNIISESNGGNWNDLESDLALLSYDSLIDTLNVYDKEGDLDGWATDTNAEGVCPNVTVALKTIPCLFREWVCTELSQIKASPQAEFRKLFSITPRKFLSFNYTPTLETVYQISEEDITHIHGYAISQESKLRFGHGEMENRVDEELLSPANEMISSIHYTLRKEYNDEALDLISPEDITGLVFYGFGFGDVDMRYIDLIREKCNGLPKPLILTSLNEDLEKYNSGKMASKLGLTIKDYDDLCMLIGDPRAEKLLKQLAGSTR